MWDRFSRDGDTKNDPHRGAAVLTEGVQLSDASLVLLMLHGRGASAADILGLGRELADVLTDRGIALLAPQAAGSTWYPNSFLAPRAQNEPWVTSALRRIESIVQESLAAGITPDRIVLCGFSQGACLATEFAASYPRRYAALLAFTGGLIGEPGTNLSHPGSLAKTPVWMSSGDPDPHVPWQRVEESGVILTGMGASVELRRFPGRPHTVVPAEIRAAQRLLAAIASQPR